MSIVRRMSFVRRVLPIVGLLILFGNVALAKLIDLKINLGGKATDGFSAEEEVLGLAENGENYSKMSYHGEIKGGGDSANVFKTQRFSRYEDLVINIPVPDGVYSVTLMFAETWKGAFGLGKRVFDVYLGSKPSGIVRVIDSFDCFKAGGAATGVQRVFSGIATQGGLSIILRPIVQNPQIAGVMIKGFSYSDSLLDDLPTTAAPAPAAEEFSILDSIGPHAHTDPSKLYDPNMNPKLKNSLAAQPSMTAPMALPGAVGQQRPVAAPGVAPQPNGVSFASPIGAKVVAPVAPVPRAPYVLPEPQPAIASVPTALGTPSVSGALRAPVSYGARPLQPDMPPRSPPFSFPKAPTAPQAVYGAIPLGYRRRKLSSIGDGTNPQLDRMEVLNAHVTNERHRASSMMGQAPQLAPQSFGIQSSQHAMPQMGMIPPSEFTSPQVGSPLGEVPTQSRSMQVEPQQSITLSSGNIGIEQPVQNTLLNQGPTPPLVESSASTMEPAGVAGMVPSPLGSQVPSAMGPAVDTAMMGAPSFGSQGPPAFDPVNENGMASQFLGPQGLSEHSAVQQAGSHETNSALYYSQGQLAGVPSPADTLDRNDAQVHGTTTSQTSDEQFSGQSVGAPDIARNAAQRKYQAQTKGMNTLTAPMQGAAPMGSTFQYQTDQQSVPPLAPGTDGDSIAETVTGADPVMPSMGANDPAASQAVGDDSVVPQLGIPGALGANPETLSSNFVFNQGITETEPASLGTPVSRQSLTSNMEHSQGPEVTQMHIPGSASPLISTPIQDTTVSAPRGASFSRHLGSLQQVARMEFGHPKQAVPMEADERQSTINDRLHPFSKLGNGPDEALSQKRLDMHAKSADYRVSSQMSRSYTSSPESKVLLEALPMYAHSAVDVDRVDESVVTKAVGVDGPDHSVSMEAPQGKQAREQEPPTADGSSAGVQTASTALNSANPGANDLPSSARTHGIHGNVADLPSNEHVQTLRNSMASLLVDSDIVENPRHSPVSKPVMKETTVRTSVDEGPGIHSGNSQLDGICLHNKTHCSCGMMNPPLQDPEECLFIREATSASSPMTCERGPCSAKLICACISGASLVCERSLVNSILVAEPTPHSGLSGNHNVVHCKREALEQGVEILTPVL